MGNPSDDLLCLMDDFAEYDDTAATFGQEGGLADMDYGDEATADFQMAYRQGETAGAEAHKKIILYSVFSGLGVVVGLTLIIVAAVFGTRACVRACRKNSKKGEEDAESTHTTTTTGGDGSLNGSYYSSHDLRPHHQAGGGGVDNSGYAATYP